MFGWGDIPHPEVRGVNGALPGPYVPARLHAVLWSHIGTLMHRLATEPCSTAGLSLPFRCPSGPIFVSPVFNGVGLVGFKSRANASLLA